MWHRCPHPGPLNERKRFCIWLDLHTRSTDKGDAIRSHAPLPHIENGGGIKMCAHSGLIRLNKVSIWTLLILSRLELHWHWIQKRLIAKSERRRTFGHNVSFKQYNFFNLSFSRGQKYFNIVLVLQDEWLIIFTHPANTCTGLLKVNAIKKH